MIPFCYIFQEYDDTIPFADIDDLKTRLREHTRPYELTRHGSLLTMYFRDGRKEAVDTNYLLENGILKDNIIDEEWLAEYARVQSEQAMASRKKIEKKGLYTSGLFSMETDVEKIINSFRIFNKYTWAQPRLSLDWITKTGSKATLRIHKYRIDYTKKAPSKGAREVKEFLKKFCGSDVVCEELRIPKTLLRVDFVNFTKKFALEYNDDQNNNAHDNFISHFHSGNKMNFVKGMKRDMDKIEQLERNGFTVIIVYKQDLPLTRAWFSEKYDINIQPPTPVILNVRLLKRSNQKS